LIEKAAAMTTLFMMAMLMTMTAARVMQMTTGGDDGAHVMILFVAPCLRADPTAIRPQ